MAFNTDERLSRGVGVPFWPANEAEWVMWHERNAAAVRVVQSQKLGDLVEYEVLDMMGLLPEQLAEQEKHMRTSSNTGPAAKPTLRGRRAPAQNRNS
jgi:hypothetical protein